MKVADITVNGVYHDGKQGLRQVISLDTVRGTLRYRLLAAKAERDYTAAGGPKSLLGTEGTVNLQSFATWAKVAYPADQLGEIRTLLAAAKLKLTPGEVALLKSLLAEIHDKEAKAGLTFTFERGELRAVNSLVKKGLLKRLDNGQAKVLALGAARLKFMASA